MTRMKTLACSVGLILVGVAPVAADNDAPKSLRMRPTKATGSQWSPMRWAKRLAQAQPADPPPAGDPAPPADASGQPAPTPAQPTPDAQATANQAPALSDEELAKLAEQEAKTEVITVTGSLIGRREVDSPSPVSVVDKEKLQSAGITNVGDVLQKIPAQGNALNAQNNNGGDGSTRVNLRGLGAQRTLVLLNGRRVVPSGTGADPSVDFGTIPLAMIERVEVLKDGASAIYGSDAIAGVVNVITRTNMNGTEANIYTSMTGKGDGTNYDLSFVTGHSSNRGNITFSGGYQNQKPVMAGDREFAKATYSYDFEHQLATLTGSSSSPTGRLNVMPSGGPPLNIAGCNTKFCTPDGNGGFRNFVNPTATTLGDQYNFQPLNYLLTPSTRINLFSNGRYDITKNVHVFYEGQFNARKSTQQLAEEPVQLALAEAPISKDNAFNHLGEDVVDYNRRLVEFGPRTFDQDVNTTRLVVGLNGTIPEQVSALKNWRWEGSYNYGRNEATQANHGSLILSHLRNALGPSIDETHCGPHGSSVDKAIPNCLPLDLLQPKSGKVTKDVINYLTFTGTQSGFNEQHTALLTASGKLMDLPNHGDVSLAVGGDYRFERGGQQPDPLTATGDTTGNAFQPTLGSYNTFEGFGELSIVPYSGGEMVKYIEVNAAGRAYKYNTFGSGATGKISGLLRVQGGVAVRGTLGTAFRAPNVLELFQGQADGFPLIEDPCDKTPPSVQGGKTLSTTLDTRCQATGAPAGGVAAGTSQQRAKNGGNPDLQPEKGTVGTVGAVYEPLRGLDFTLDYWHINIDNAITTLPVPTILSQCYDAGNMEFCKQIQRNATGQISYIFDLTQNVGGFTTSGLDFSAAYQYRNQLGTFRHALEGTYLFQNNVDTGTKDPKTMKENIIHGRGNYDLFVNPDLKFNIFTTWIHPVGVGAGFNFRFVDSYHECDSNTCNDPASSTLRREVSKYATGDLFVTYSLKSSQGTTSLTAGMNNVVNVQPPIIYNGPALNADESVYDFLGRQVYIRFGQLF
jgi:iron complex outermembrane receptor protein